MPIVRLPRMLRCDRLPVTSEMLRAPIAVTVSSPIAVIVTTGVATVETRHTITVPVVSGKPYFSLSCRTAKIRTGGTGSVTIVISSTVLYPRAFGMMLGFTMTWRGGAAWGRFRFLP